jgi:hypothetical protein
LSKRIANQNIMQPRRETFATFRRQLRGNSDFGTLCLRGNINGCAIVTIDDRGRSARHHDIDLSPAAARGYCTFPQQPRAIAGGSVSAGGKRMPPSPIHAKCRSARDAGFARLSWRKWDTARCNELLGIKDIDLHAVGHDHVTGLLVGRTWTDPFGRHRQVLPTFGVASLCDVIV